MGFSFDPAVMLGLLVVEGLYVRAVVKLRRRGWEVGAGQQVAWHAGVALTAVGLLSPIDGLGEELLSAHMAQHLLIADLAAPLLLVGLRTPVLVHFLPRAALVALARRKRVRAVFRFVRRPLPAISLWVLTLYGWHFVFAFEGALDNGLVHAVQHESFVATSLLVWWPVLEPKRSRLHGELWKIGHLLGARLAGMMLGMAFLILRAPAYEGFYGDSAREHGLTPLADQQLAGGLMLTLDVAIMLFALGFFFWRSGVDHDRAERAAAATS
ncbi:MAG: cytochrome c oxidase assembly protein [Actinomycetota bacterium]|nr:cytochrome c oxidase assembly protein [Actinomycetota bacterium]